ncbi:MAG TPA: hypothetical protein VJQ06_00255 [Rhizomicrobium sp.]|nr:hypothetical protein [Rhizomicrobium sp.]
MRGEYDVGLAPGGRLDRGAVPFAHSGTIILVLMAAIPAALGLLQQEVFDASIRPVTFGGQNAAITARTLGNQPPERALADGVNAMPATQGGVLALCSGTSGAGSGARLKCTALASTIQR